MPWISKAHLALLAEIDARAAADHEALRFANEQLRSRAEGAEITVARLQGELAVLERQNAVHQTNNDWLRGNLNTITFERQQRLTLQLLERDIVLTPDSEITSLPHDKRPRVDKQAERRETAVAEATSGQAIFEDMGDDAAAALGVEWGTGGEVVHKKG